MNYAYHKSVSICDVCVPFLSHTELTELTDIISLDVNIFCAFRAFRVPLFGPTDYLCPSVASVWHKNLR